MSAGETGHLQEKQEAQEAASAQLKREKVGQEERCRELRGQLERLRVEKTEGDREIGSLRASLRGGWSLRWCVGWDPVECL